MLPVTPQDDSTLCSGTTSGSTSAVIPASPSPSIRTLRADVSQDYTESALRELYQHVNNMPESTKKKKLIRQVPSLPAVMKESSETKSAYVAFVFLQFEKQPLQGSTDSRTPFSRKHWRSRSLGGIIKVLYGRFLSDGFQSHNMKKNFFFYGTEESVGRPGVSRERKRQAQSSKQLM